MKARTSQALVAAVAALLVLSGCSSASTGGGGQTGEASPSASSDGSVDPAAPKNLAPYDGAEPGSGEGLTIGYISLGESSPFVALVTQSLREQAEIAGADLVVCDANFDAAKALDCARSFETQGVDGMVTFQLDESAAAAICEAGPDVPVIAVDIHQEPCERSFMGADNERAGYIGGQTLGNFFDENFGCEYSAFVSMETPAAGGVNRIRMDGLRNGFESVCGEIPDSDVRTLDGKGTLDEGQRVFADLLTSLPGQDKIAVVAIDGGAYCLAAIAAAKQAGREDDIWCMGQGGAENSIAEIRVNEHYVGDTAYFPERYGNIAIPGIIDLINEGDVPELMYVDHVVVTADNVDDVYPN